MRVGAIAASDKISRSSLSLPRSLANWSRSSKAEYGRTSRSFDRCNAIKAIGGTIDPGPDAVPFKTATLDSATWTVHIEAERPAKGATAAVRYVIDGKLANLGSYNRTLGGTWTDGATKGDFKLTRD